MKCSEKFKWQPFRRLKNLYKYNTDVGLQKPGCDYMQCIQTASKYLQAFAKF